MPRETRFSFRQRGGICAGEQWIFDGDEPIARLHTAIIEQPEQNLRYFDRVLKPIELRDLRLKPGGRPLVAGAQLYWKMGPVATTELVSVRVSGQESERLILEVVSRDPGGVATSRRVLTLGFDAASSSYIYHFDCHLDLHSPEVFDNPRDGSGEWRFEYCDPWYCDIPGPVAPFPGMWEKRYTRLLAEKADGKIWQMPLNHMATGIPSPRSFAEGGLFVAAPDPGNNPAFEFVGETAARTSASVCNWGYDIHLQARYTPDQLYAPIREQFRIRLCPDAKVEDLLARAEPVPRVEYAGFTELPLYERRTSFAVGLDLSQPTPGATDPWPWLPSGEGCQWSKEEGRSDSFSLKIAKQSPGPSEWTMNREGDGAWLETWTPATGYRVRAWVRTQAVGGRGSCLALRWAVYNYPERYPYVCSQKLVGTHGWTQVEATLQGPPPPGISSICIALRQDGPGTTCFDDLEVEILQGECACTT